MKAFDTDVLTEILLGSPSYAERFAQVPLEEQGVPIVALEEIIRGRFNIIRQAEAGKSRISIAQAYLLLERTLRDINDVRILSFDQTAEHLVKDWRKNRTRGSTHDLRIAAICVCASATLVTRNRRDFQQIPNLLLEVWD